MKSVFGLQWEVRFIKQPAITVSNPACSLSISSFFNSIHSGDTWPNKGSIYLQDLWGPRDRSSSGPRWERVMTWIWPQWAQWAPAHGESWTQSLKSVSFWCQQIRFQASCSFCSHLSAPCRSRPADTLKRAHFTLQQIVFVVTFHFPILFFYICFLFFRCAFSALPLLHLAEEGRNEAACPCPTQCSSRMPQTDKARDFCLRSREMPARGLWDEHHISEFTKRSFWYTSDGKEAAAPPIHGRAAKQAAALCGRHGGHDRDWV